MQRAGQLGGAGLTPEQAIATVNRMIDQQAYTLAATDLFYLSALLFLSLVAWCGWRSRNAARPGRCRRRALTRSALLAWPASGGLQKR